VRTAGIDHVRFAGGLSEWKEERIHTYSFELLGAWHETPDSKRLPAVMPSRACQPEDKAVESPDPNHQEVLKWFVILYETVKNQSSN
jgi:hypothetical protein